MGTATTLEERVRILELAQSGHSDPQIAATVGLSAVTVRKWRRRGMHGGRAALVSTMGRPRRGALSTFPAPLGPRLRQWREAHPRWGPKTLRAQEEVAGCRDGPAPRRASIARFLKETGLARRYTRHSQLPAEPRLFPREPHQEWEMDARGAAYLPEVGVVSLVDLNDRFSHARLQSFPCRLGAERVEHQVTTADYQRVLRLTFLEWGLPDRLAVDHDAVFIHNDSASPFPTRRHLWLLALGVTLIFNRVHCPTDQAITERRHQLWDQQVLAGPGFADCRSLETALRERRSFLNEHLPCSTLGEQPPLIAYPAARTPRREYHPAREAELLDVARIERYLARGHWFRLVSDSGSVSLGNQVYWLGRAPARQQIEVRWDAEQRQLVFLSAAEELIGQSPLKGVSVPELLGDLAPLVGHGPPQLRLPLTWEDARAVRLCETLAGTTS